MQPTRPISRDLSSDMKNPSCNRHVLTEEQRKMYYDEYYQCMEALEQAEDSSLSSIDHHVALINFFNICQNMKFLIPMFPTFRVMVQDKINTFEADLTENRITMDPLLQEYLVHGMAVTEEVIANADCSPYYVSD